MNVITKTIYLFSTLERVYTIRIPITVADKYQDPGNVVPNIKSFINSTDPLRNPNSI